MLFGHDLLLFDYDRFDLIMVGFCLIRFFSYLLWFALFGPYQFLFGSDLFCVVIVDFV